MSARDQSLECLRDIDPDFIKTAAITAAWEYSKLFDELESNASLSDDYRKEEFNARRGGCLVRALTVAADKHGVPYEFVRLASNGQSKLIVRCGRVILVQEPIVSISDAPRSSDYKVELAEAHGLVRQLELDLGDKAVQTVDWQGNVFGVVLHAAVGIDFDRDSRALGCLMLGIPDAAYTHWVVRLDLHSVAMNGAHFTSDMPSESEEAIQSDRVFVSLKKRAQKAI